MIADILKKQKKNGKKKTESIQLFFFDFIILIFKGFIIFKHLTNKLIILYTIYLKKYNNIMTTVNNNAFNTTSYDMYQVDAFASKVFEGNPAAVIPMKGNTWFTDEKMQQIATENNLSETAFLISKDTTNNNNSDNNENNNTCEYDIRWFTPNVEVD